MFLETGGVFRRKLCCVLGQRHLLGYVAVQHLVGHFRIKWKSREISLGSQSMASFQGGGDIVYGAEGQDGADGQEVHPAWAGTCLHSGQRHGLIPTGTSPHGG